MAENEFDSNEYRQFLQEQHEARGGTERRPGQRTVSTQEDINAGLAAAQTQQQEVSGEPSQASRWPIGATAVGIGTALAVGALTKNMPLAMTAAGLSGAAGDITQSGVEELFDLPTKAANAVEMGQRAAFEGAMQAIGEGVGRLPIAAAKKTGLLNFFKSDVSPEAARAMRFLEARGMESPTMLPAMATENRGLDILHNFTEHAILGGGAIRRHNLRSANFTAQLADESVNRLAPLLDDETTAELLVLAAKEGKDVFHAPASILYNSIQAEVAPKVVRQAVTDQATGKKVTQRVTTGGLRTNIKRLKDFLEPSIAERERLGHIGDTTTGGNILDVIQGYPDKPYLSDMMKLATIIRVQKEGLQTNIATKNDPSIGMLKQIEKRLHGSIHNTLLVKKPALLAAKGEADRLYKFGSKTYNNRVIRNLARKLDFDKAGAGPEQVVKTVFAPGHAARMQVVKNAVDEKTWKTIAARGMKNILEQSKDKAGPTGVLQGDVLLKKLIAKGGEGGIGEKGLVTAVGPIEAQRWISLAKAIQVQQSKQGAKEGAMLVQLQQGAVILGAVTGAGGFLLGDTEIGAAGLGATGLFIGLPMIAGRIMANPTAARALIEGLTTPQTASAAKIAGITGRIMQAMVPRSTERQPSQPTAVSTALNQTGLSPFSGTPFQNRVQP